MRKLIGKYYITRLKTKFADKKPDLPNVNQLLFARQFERQNNTLTIEGARNNNKGKLVYSCERH